MASDKLYPFILPSSIEPHFSNHMQAMTSERLDAKSAIAAQLAWRDKRIAELEKEVERIQTQVDKWISDALRRCLES